MTSLRTASILAFAIVSVGALSTACNTNQIVGLGGSTSAASGTTGTSNTNATTGNGTTGNGTGMGMNACQIYANDAKAALAPCPPPMTTTSATSSTNSTSTGMMQTCTPALATKAMCLDACLSHFDCCFIANPSDPACQQKEQAYAGCVSPC